MRTNIVALPYNGTLQEAQEFVHHDHRPRGQYLFPVVDSKNRLLGVVTRKHLMKLIEQVPDQALKTRISEIATVEPVVAFAD